MAQQRGRALIGSMWKTVYVWEGPFLQDSEERGREVDGKASTTTPFYLRLNFSLSLMLTTMVKLAVRKPP